jgi:hypothetical protein
MVEVGTESSRNTESSRSTACAHRRLLRPFNRRAAIRRA